MNRQDRIQELEEAFTLFNQTSERLTQSYDALQDRTQELQAQLDATNREKERVANRLERLVQLLPAAIIVLDDHNRITELNPSAETLLTRDAVGKTWQAIQRQVFINKNNAGELVSNQNRIYQLTHTALDQELGRILVLQDVTDARRLQEHMNRHQRLTSMGEMAASLAHQIRTPLASALLYASQLNEGDLTSQQRSKFTSKVQSSLHHLEGLVQEMLQYAKGGSSSQKRISVQSVIESSVRNSDTRVQASKAQLSCELSDAELEIVGDPEALSTAIQNLVNNALDIIEQDARIQISVQQDQQFVKITVSDNGPGIAQENLEKIFEPFFTSRAKGTGLGLAVVRAVVEAHHGEVLVQSIVGYGTKFIIRLPLADQS